MSKHAEEMQRRYRTIFGSDEGKAVLHDMATKVGFFDATDYGRDRNHWNAGMRSVIIFIMSQLEDPPDVAAMVQQNEQYQAEFFRSQQNQQEQ